MDENRLTYSVPEVAAALGISTRTGWRLVHGGELPHVRVGGRVLVLRDDLTAFVDARRSVPATA